MAALDDLIAQIEDETLRERIQAEVRRANKQKKFGLVFEQHLPEATPLYDVPIKKGSLVAVKGQSISNILFVESISAGKAVCVQKSTKEKLTILVKDLVTVAQFGEPIYPFLQLLDSVCNAPKSDLWHTLIEADNYHALQLLEYLYAGKVDCIYIDPPYNTGARDWKYNNDYVDSSDNYRHSKWLSMMEKRLRLAKRLLNPADSALIVTIDEKEFLHLGCLLEEIFPEANIQMISSVINHASVARFNEFNRNNEYIFFVMIGNYELQSIDDSKTAIEGSEVAWNTLRRHSPSNTRPTRPRQFYPIYINKKTHKIEKVGDPVSPDVNRFSVPSMDGCETVFPVRENGTEMLWGVVPDELRRRIAGGYVRVGKYEPEKPQQFGIQVLPSGPIKDIEQGALEVEGYRDDGSVIVKHKGTKKVLPKSQWDYETHDAKTFGSNILKAIFPETRFSYPKSIYAVEDCLKLFVGHKTRALIVDFFAGSGTTLHAVNLLNAEDCGNRRCIMVTNNELSVEESKRMSEEGYHPGDSEWEKLGIAHYVAWPRTFCSIKGHDINGVPLKGSYVCGCANNSRPMSDGFKSNVVFFKLGFLNKTSVSLGRHFNELLPLLWLKAGAHGPCPQLKSDVAPEIMVLAENQFAVLTEEAMYEEFANKINSNQSIKTVFIVTDSEPGYREMISGLKVKNAYQLYRDYLDNFRINRRS